MIGWIGLRSTSTADPNEPLARNLSNVYYRRSGLQVQFRVEHYNGWAHYTDSIGGIDVALFFDTDRDSSTGQTTVAEGSIPLNDIGAEYRFIVGRNGDVFDRWDGSNWTGDGFVEDLIIQDNSNFFEVSLTTARLGDPSTLDVVAAFVNGDSFPLLLWDFAPDSSHATIVLDHDFAVPLTASKRLQEDVDRRSGSGQNPFN
jgi:hypothetical protein